VKDFLIHICEQMFFMCIHGRTFGAPENSGALFWEIIENDTFQFKNAVFPC
jgi:hypothetical protein